MSLIKGFKEVFSKPQYVLLMLISAFIFYLISIVITDFIDFKVIFVNYGFSLKLIFSYFIGFPSTIDAFSAYSMILVAILFGSYLSLATYKTKQVKALGGKSSFIGSIGIFFGFLAPGCAACGLGLASVFGLAGFVVALPFHGMEVSVIAFLLLGYANLRIASKVGKNTCSIRVK